MALKVFLATCLFIASAAAQGCSSVDAWKSLKGPGSGGYWLKKTTEAGKPKCTYVKGSEFNDQAKKAKYTFGSLGAGNMLTKTTAEASAQGKLIVVGTDKSEVHYSDGKTCDVVELKGNTELWVHSSSTGGYNSCCDTEFSKRSGGKQAYNVHQDSCPSMP